MTEIEIPDPRFQVTRPPLLDAARVSAESALSTAREAGLLPVGATRQRVALALLTDAEYGPVINGRLQPLIQDRLVWLISFRAAPSHSGGGAPGVADDPMATTAALCRNLLVTDAVTGEHVSGAENCQVEVP